MRCNFEGWRRRGGHFKEVHQIGIPEEKLGGIVDFFVKGDGI